MDEKERLAEYLICQKRGHDPSGYVTASVPPKNRCRWCGTFYWVQSILREVGQPRPSEELTPEQEASLRSHGL
jgi:hypothetical protein